MVAATYSITKVGILYFAASLSRWKLVSGVFNKDRVFFSGDPVSWKIE